MAIWKSNIAKMLNYSLEIIVSMRHQTLKRLLILFLFSEIEIISSDGVQVVKQTEGTNFAPQDQLFNGLDNFVDNVNDAHDEETAVDYDESSEDYYEEDYDEDYEDSDYEDYPSSEEIQGSFLNAKPMDFLDGLNGEVIADNISLDDIEHIKAVLNNQDGAEHELVWWGW